MNIRSSLFVSAVLLTSCLLGSVVVAQVPPPGVNPRSSANRLPQNNDNVKKKKVSQPAQNLLIDFHEIPISEALRVLSLQQGVNIIAEPDVQGDITLHLENVSLDEGLSLLLETVGAEFVKKDSVYRVRLKNAKKQNAKQEYQFAIEDGLMSIQARDFDLKKILQDIAFEHGQNIVFDNSVRGLVTVNLQKVPVRKALDIILKSNGFQIEDQQNIWKVVREVRDQKFTVRAQGNEVSVKATGAQIKEVLQALSVQTGVSIVTSGYVQGTVDVNIENSDIESVLKMVLVGTNFQFKKHKDIYVVGDGLTLQSHSLFFVHSDVIKLKHVNAEDVIQKLPPSFPQTNIQALEGLNAVAVSGSAEMVQSARTLLEKLDQPVPQIIVDVLAVEYLDDVDKTFGLSVNDGREFPFGNDFVSYSVDVTQATQATLTYDLAERLTRSFTLNLNALVQDGKAKIYANPTIRTLNGQEATIDVVIEDRFRENRFDESTGRLEPVGTPRSIESGVKLRIVPRLTGDNQINIEIEPEVSNNTGVLSSDDLPQTSTRRLKTVLKVKNGKTIILGGLIQNNIDRGISKVPILGDIPFISPFFKRTTAEDRHSELVFYITPRLATEADYLSNFNKEDELAKQIEENKSAYTDISGLGKLGERDKEDWIKKRKPLFERKSELSKPQKQKAPQQKLQDMIDNVGWDEVIGPNHGTGYEFDEKIQSSSPKPLSSDLLKSYNREVESILAEEQELLGEINENDLLGPPGQPVPQT